VNRTRDEPPGPYRPPAGVAKAELAADPLARELLQARLIAKLATFNADGSIHLVAMWFLWDGEALLIPTNGGTRKAKNLRRDPRATVMIDDSRGGFDLCGITLVCDCELIRAPASAELNRPIHLKYVTEVGLGREAVRGYLATDDVTLRLVPHTLGSWDLRPTPQARALQDGEFHPLDRRPVASPDQGVDPGTGEGAS
jgi:PPOX class probable F420-dependent enzyme